MCDVPQTGGIDYVFSNNKHYHSDNRFTAQGRNIPHRTNIVMLLVDKIQRIERNTCTLNFVLLIRTFVQLHNAKRTA